MVSKKLQLRIVENRNYLIDKYRKQLTNSLFGIKTKTGLVRIIKKLSYKNKNNIYV